MGYETNSDMEKKQKVKYNGFIPCNPEKWSAEECKYLMKELGSKAETVLRTLLETTDREEMKNRYTSAISRQKVAYLIGEVMGERKEIKKGDISKFSDWSQVDSKYKEGLAKMVGCGILRGNVVDNGLKVEPDKTITRVEALALIDRFYCLVN